MVSSMRSTSAPLLTLIEKGNIVFNMSVEYLSNTIKSLKYKTNQKTSDLKDRSSTMVLSFINNSILIFYVSRQMITIDIK